MKKRFCLQIKPGGLIRVHTSVLQPTSLYKSLFISEETTSDELLTLLLSCYNSVEPVEQFSLYEVCVRVNYTVYIVCMPMKLCVCVCTSTFHLFFLIPFRSSYIKCIWLNKMVIFPSRYVQHKSINVNYIQTIYHCVPNSYAHSAVNNAISLYARIRYTRDVDSYCRQLSKINQQHQRQRPQHQRRRWRRRQ